MTGPRRTKGSGSNRQRNDENDPVPNRTGPPYLCSDSDEVGAVWWEDDEITKAIGESITENYTEWMPCWTETPSPLQDKIFNTFKSKVRTDLSDKDLRSTFEVYVKPRLTKITYRVAHSKKKPCWVPVCIYQRLQKRKDDDAKFRKASAVATANRLSGAVDGKATGTHCFGRSSTAKVLRNLVKESDTGEPSPIKLLEKSKKTKQGKWLTARAEQIEAEYNAREAEIAAGKMNESEAYLSAVGGFNDKGRVYGTGRLAGQLWKAPSQRTRGGQASVVQPGLLTRYASENAELKKKVSDLEAQGKATASQTEWLLMKMQEEYGWAPPDPTCTPGPNPHRRDDFDDDQADAHQFPIAPGVH